MEEGKVLADEFEANRDRLRNMAFRLLGSLPDAEETVQEAWLRLSRAEPSTIGNVSGWLTTVVSRLCFDLLRSRRTRDELLQARWEEADFAAGVRVNDLEQEAELAEAVGLAMMVVLDQLAPAERIAFVLRDVFDFSFEAIGHVVGRKPAAARQLASRARRRVRGAECSPVAGTLGQRAIVEAFLAASRDGDFAGLMAIMDPTIVLHADKLLRTPGVPGETHGSAAVAAFFKGRAGGARTIMIDGTAGLVIAPGGKVRLALTFRIEDGRICEIHAIAAPDRLRDLAFAVFDKS